MAEIYVMEDAILEDIWQEVLCSNETRIYLIHPELCKPEHMAELKCHIWPNGMWTIVTDETLSWGLDN